MHGFILVERTPYDDPEETRRLLERIAHIRVTHYGGFYDFTPNLAMADTAYTNIALPAHTDTTYFTEPAGLQAFHLLSHQPAPGEEGKTAKPGGAEHSDQTKVPQYQDNLGGQTLLVDGYLAASIMRRENEHLFNVLCEYGIPAHASGNKGIAIAPDKLYPVLTVHPWHPDRILQVRWNNDDRGVVPFNNRYYSPQHWYKAARLWDNIIRRDTVEHWISLKPGTVLSMTRPPPSSPYFGH